MEFNSTQTAMIKNSMVCYLIPCYGGAVFEKFFVSFIRSIIQMRNDGLNFSLETLANESLVTRARNNLVAKGMTNGNATHLMFIDADVGFNTNDIYKLIAHNKDVICGLYPKKDYPLEYVVNRLEQTDPDENGLIKVRHAGTGFMLIKRHVIEKMFKHYANTKVINDTGMEQKYTPNMYALFDTAIDPNSKRYLSEDYLFCERWIAMGGEVWVDTTVKLSHSGYHTFGQ